jgi:molybdopterin-guanine dinucleotide biosynthesis protein A
MSGFAAIVLAGGFGRRLGDPAKPERPVGGVPMLSRVLGAVAAASPLVVVGPPRLAALLPAGVRLTIEDPPGGGPVAALGAGLALLDPPPDPPTELDSPAALAPPLPPALVALLAADLPFLTGATVALLRRTVGTSTSRGAVLVDDTDRPQWLCGVWRQDALATRLAELGDLGGRSLREALGPLAPTLVRPEASSGPPGYFDCDTEQDLRRAEEWSHDGAG